MTRTRRTGEPRSLETSRALLSTINGSWMTQAVYVAARLGIPDLMARGIVTGAGLSRATRAHAPSLRRFMRALATLDLCRQVGDDRYALTATGSLLRSDVPESLRDWALYWGGTLWPVWGRLLESVRTGRSARVPAGAKDKFDRLDADRRASAVFDRAMAQLTRLDGDAIARTVDFSGVRWVVDIGGGDGALLVALLSVNAHARGLLLERAPVVGRARERIGLAGLADRCGVAAGDFFRAIPWGADVYVLKSVIHDWDDANALRILRNARCAMGAHARLVLVERIVPRRLRATPSDRAVARADLNMMIGLGGRERTEGEYRALLRLAGLRVVAIRSAGPVFGVVEAVGPR